MIDPHGNLAETIQAAVPSVRTNDVILFDAADAAHPIAFNPLACADPRQRSLVASAVRSTFKKLYGDSWGPRLAHILRNTLFTLLDLPEASLILVPRLLTDGRFRQQALQRTTDPVVREFWEREFAQLPPKFQAEATAPVLNKVGQFLTNPVLRRNTTRPAGRSRRPRLGPCGRTERGVTHVGTEAGLPAEDPGAEGTWPRLAPGDCGIRLLPGEIPRPGRPPSSSTRRT